MEVEHLLPRPMPQNRFVKFTKELLERPGSPVAGVEDVCTYWGRRVFHPGGEVPVRKAGGPGCRRPGSEV